MTEEQRTQLDAHNEIARKAREEYEAYKNTLIVPDVTPKNPQEVVFEARPNNFATLKFETPEQLIEFQRLADELKRVNQERAQFISTIL